MSCKSSRAAVPCPAITWGWLKGGDKGVVIILLQLLCDAFASGLDGVVKDDVATVVCCGIEFSGRSIVGHDDNGFEAEVAPYSGNRLGMVAGGEGDKASVPLGWSELGNSVVGSSVFECANFLKVFAFEKDFCSHHCVEGG